MSLRRFDGWEPSEVHETYDAHGALTGKVVVTREPEFNDTERAWWLGWVEYQEQGKCPVCGGHHGRTFDETVNRDVRDVDLRCLDCRSIDIYRRQYHDQHRHKDKADECEACQNRTFYVHSYVPRR